MQGGRKPRTVLGGRPRSAQQPPRRPDRAHPLPAADPASRAHVPAVAAVEAGVGTRHRPDLSVRDCARRGRGARFRALATGALLRFPTPGIPSVSVEINRSAYNADEWYRQAMERAVGSVRVASPRALNGLELPPCARAGALAVRSPRTVLTLPDPAADLPSFGRLAELSLSLVQLGGARPLGEFLASCCPRLRTLRLCSVRGPALRRLALRTDALEVLDVSNVDDLTLTSLDVAATNLRCLSVRSCFRSPTGGGGEVARLSTKDRGGPLVP
ncbi:uncharacterized protein LOC112883098 isoform X2 [Panicum hallii]|jgi:hypothetical protein|uniref:uncharacterized protein LOC112883098 isoform X2 n=1 Tax=Panicum hallii TaxID=206008 RepID=UPI000DF4EE15|nr:uncharacterized protein LOC112883098 isoform X2 [Panicum hallii]